MLTKFQAIQILENYLYDFYTSDSMYGQTMGVNRPSIEETPFCWIMLACPTKYLFEPIYFPGLGGFYYLIDKENGKIYTSPGNVEIDWVKDFYNFKIKKDFQLNWQPLELTYLKCYLGDWYKKRGKKVSLNIAVNDKNKLVKQIFAKKQPKKWVDNPRLRYNAIDGIRCEIEMEFFTNNKEEPCERIDTINLNFSGGFAEYASHLNDLKKWIRVNRKKGTDNYWIEIKERNFKKEFMDWDLIFVMEYQEF